MQKILCSLLLSALVLAADAQCTSNLNFNNWIKGGQPGNGNWVLQNGGLTVHQTVNGSPTFFYSPFDLMNTHISGQFRSTDFDDDWMGFVFSYNNPLGASDSFDCWLFDWKQEFQGSSPRGMALSRVDGLITNYGLTFQSHVNTPEFTVVQNDFGGPGWNRSQNHNFDLYVTYTKSEIYVDGVLKFTWPSCFKPGRFGFYNLSQKDCYYSNFTYEMYIDFQVPPQVCRGASAPFNFTNPCVNNMGAYQSMTWDFGDGTPPLVINNPTLATANVTHIYSAQAVYTATLTMVDFNGCSATASHTIDVRNPIVLTPTLNQPPCNGGTNGSIVMVASQGFGNYQYSWSDGTSQSTLVGASAGTYTITVTDGICNSSAQYTLNQPTALTAVTSHTDANCNQNNGTATIAISGGTPPYQGVNWGPSFPGASVSGLAAGTFIADFTDANGCSAALQYKETIGSLPCGITSSSVTSTAVSCRGGNNGTATLTVTGGNPVGVTWTGGRTGFSINMLPAGVYSFSYQDANPALNFTGTVTVNQPNSPMSATMSTIGITCAGSNNGQAIASVDSGGFPPYNYAWSGGHPNTPVANNLAPGPISVVVTDSKGCTASASGTVSGIPSLVAVLTPTQDSCYRSGNGKIIASVSGGAQPYTYAWNNFDTDSANLNIIEGTYTLSVTDANGCSITRSAAVTGPASAIQNSFTTQHVNCTGASTGSLDVTVTGGTPGSGYTYAWTPNTITGSSATNLAAGIYTWTVTDSYGCITYGIDTVLQPDSALVATSSHTDVTCGGANDGTLSITIAGGTPSYFYQGQPVPRTNFLTGLAGGVYSGTVTDALGCSVALTETIIEPTPVTVTETNVDVLCNGASTGSIDISAGGGVLPHTFIWNDGILTEDRSNLTAGNYSVIVSDSNLCSASISVTISEPAAFSITAVATDVLCNGGNTGSINTTPSGGVPAYTFLWNDGDVNQNRTNMLAGNYSVTTTDNNLCTASVGATVSEPSPLAVTTSHTDVTCNGANDGTVAIDVSGGTPGYFYLGNSVPAGTTVIPNLAPLTYAGNVTDANGCSVPVSETVSEPTALTVTETNVDVVCFGASTGSIDINPSGGVLPHNFLWNDGILTEDRANLIAGVYSVTVSDSNLCSVSVSVTISEPNAFTITATPTDVLCNGGSTGSINTTVSGGIPAYTFLWNDGDVNQNRANILAGNYSVTTTDNNLCTASVSVTVSEPGVLVVTTSHTDVTCNGANDGAVTVNVSGGSPGYFFLGNSVPAGTTIIPNLAPMTYAGNVTDNNGCSVAVSETVLEPAALTVSETTVDALCFGASNGSIDITSSGGVLPHSFAWNDAAVTEDRNNITAGTYTVTVSDNNLCSVSISATVSEPAAVVMVVDSIQNASCFGGNGSATATPVGGNPPFTFNWSNGGTGQTISLPAGNYTVSSTDASTCQQTASFSITEPSAVVVQEVHTNVSCFGLTDGSIDLTVTGGTGTNYVYGWDPNVSSSNSATGLAADSYDITVTDENSCTVLQTVNITSPPQLFVTLTPADPLCFGASTGTVTAVGSGGSATYSYVLTDGSTPQNSSTGIFSSLIAGNYQVTVTDANSCTASASTVLNDPAQFISNVTVADVSCYQSTDGQINVTVTSGGTPVFTYSVSNGVGQNATGLFTGLSSGTYSVTVTDANSCSTTGSAVITEPDPVEVTATPGSITLNLGETIRLQVSSNQGGIPIYMWEPAVGLSCYECPDPEFSGNNSTAYTASVTNAAGCAGSVTVTVNVVPAYDIFFPSAFTPNSDGTNDTWQMFGKVKGIKQIQVSLFNRWGEKVFETTDVNFGWNGDYRGESAPAGVYSYVAKLVWLDNHSDSDYRGTITLLR